MKISALRLATAPLAALVLLAAAGCGGGSGGTGGGGTSGGGSSGGSTSSGGSSGTTSGSATLDWTAPTTNEDGSTLSDLTGYHVYVGASADLLNREIDVGGPSTHYVVDNLAAGTWYFAVTAVNSVGLESNLSNTVSKTIQ